MPLQNLAERSNNGIAVSLDWDSDLNTVFITTDDLHTGVSSAFMVPSEKALDAFHHPFAYEPHHLVPEGA